MMMHTKVCREQVTLTEKYRPYGRNIQSYLFARPFLHLTSDGRILSLLFLEPLTLFSIG